MFLTPCLLLLLTVCFGFAFFTSLALPLSLTFTAELAAELLDATGQPVGPWDDSTSSLNIKCVLKKSWPDRRFPNTFSVATELCGEYFLKGRVLGLALGNIDVVCLGFGQTCAFKESVSRYSGTSSPG